MTTGSARASGDKTGRAYDHIRERIADRSLPPGSRLLFGEIAAAVGISVVPVREAVRRLEAEGLVTVERNVGAFVAWVDEAAYLQAMQVIAIVEGAATAAAAPFVDEARLAEAAAINAEMVRLIDEFDPATAARLNHRFHDVLTRDCPNPELAAVAAHQWARLAGIRDESCSFTLDGARSSVVEHERLLQLIRDRADGFVIEEHMRAHRLRATAAFLTGRRGAPALQPT